MENGFLLAEKFMRELVAIKSVNGNEAEVAKYISGVLAPYGFETEIQEIEPGRANIFARYGKSNRRVLLTGHMDTVPPGDGWSTNSPFEVEKRGSRYYGRGVCDMKGGIACMMASAIRAIEENEVKDLELQLGFVVDEEVSGSGSKKLCASIAPRDKTIAVIGEPTMLEAHIAHRGANRFLVRIIGRQSHAGLPYEGSNAIYHAARFLLAVQQFDLSRQKMDCGILPPPNMTATICHAGVKENAVPGVAEIILDCRTVPGETRETLQAQLEDMLHELFGGSEVRYEIENRLSVPPSSIDKDGLACKTVGKAYYNAFDEEQRVTYFTGCCDMPYFCKAGHSQTLLCGPGNMPQAHTVDEYIEEDQLRRAVALYREIIRVAQR